MNKERCGILVFAGICLGVAAGLLIPKPNFMTEAHYVASLAACEQARDRLLTGSTYD